MNELEGLIRQRIERDGPMTFEAYMSHALYEPGLGYYTSTGTEIGRGGDFYTSPHLHPIFGQMLGRQVEELWEALGRPGEFKIIEPGGGRGFLAYDMLEYLRNRDIYTHLAYTLIELNPAMAERQRELLKDHTDRLAWATELSQAGEAGIIVSNELLDALPVRMVRMGEDGIEEVCVGINEGRLVEVFAQPRTGAIENYLEEFGVELSAGYRTEVCLALRGWVRRAAAAITRGFIITIDYGYPAENYYAEERDRGTLLCYRQHRVDEDPLDMPGQKDITAHVNFSSLKRWGEAEGLQCEGFSRQGPYLVSMGIDETISSLYAHRPDFAEHINKIKGLIMPGAMGDTHYVMVQSKGVELDGPLRGFLMKDEARSL